MPPARTASLCSDQPRAAAALSQNWALIEEAAQAVAVLAGLAPEQARFAELPLLNALAQGPRLAAAERQIADLAEMMICGISALVSAQSRGGADPAAALALWNEFARARSMLLAPLEPVRAAAAEA